MTGELSEDFKSIKLEHGGIMRRLFQPWAGKKLLVNVTQFRRRRSDRQNRWIHGPCINRIRVWEGERTGETPSHDEVYTFLRTLCGCNLKIAKLYGQEVITMTGKRFSQMTTVEFSEAMETIMLFFGKKGCTIDPPKGESLWSDYADD